MTAWLGLIALLLIAAPARAELWLPLGFTTEVYVTGQGFETSGERGVSGIPAVGTLGMDAAGTLYLSRTGARFRSVARGVIDFPDLAYYATIVLGALYANAAALEARKG